MCAQAETRRLRSERSDISDRRVEANNEAQKIKNTVITRCVPAGTARADAPLCVGCRLQRDLSSFVDGRYRRYSRMNKITQGRADRVREWYGAAAW